MDMSENVRACASLTGTLITCLSEDILLAIFQDDCLDYDDIIALRMTCHTLSNAAAVLLFRRIQISQLRCDRDNFLSICSSPHLAQHVREVDWQEVSWFPGYFVQTPDPDESIDQTLAKIEDSADQLFWLNVVPPENPAIDTESLQARRNGAIAEFRNHLHKALANLPLLQTIISRPMPEDRILNCSEYPIAIRYLSCHHASKPQGESKWLPQTNDGLFLFLLPAIESSLCPATRLLWEDESLVTGSYLRQSFPGAFRRLDTLSISITPSSEMRYPNFVANLDAAANVRNLSLETTWESSCSHLQLSMLRFRPLEMASNWSRLHSLSLKLMPEVRHILAAIVGSSAETLRHLHISNCSVPFTSVQKLAGIQTLHLDSFRVIDYLYGPDLYIDEHHLMSFINKEPVVIHDHFIRLPDRPSRADSEMIVTTTIENVPESRRHTLENQTDVEKQSACNDNYSDDSRQYRLHNGPKWYWDHFPSAGGVYYYQVPDTHPEASPTKCWRFISRDNIVGYGDDPLDWFEEWDPEAGDVEEPTPYCYDLFDYLETYFEMDEPVSREAGSDGDPPVGAIKYDDDEAHFVYDVGMFPH